MQNKVTILDGGMGKLLERMGAPFKRPEWSALALIEEPSYVSRAHDEFIEAGAEVIITNAYALVPFHIGQQRFDQEGRALINLSARLARDCADKSTRDIKVAGCIPPAFGSYRPDLYIEEQADDIYRPLIEEQDSHVDLWIAETLSSIKEAEKITALLKDNDKPLWLAFTVRDVMEDGETPQLRSREPIEEAINFAIKNGVAAILFNCSQPEAITPVIKLINEMNLEIPYGVYANAFEPIRRDQNASCEVAELRDDTSPESYLKSAQEWADLGASIIGGCCGINPEHIQALQKLKT